METKDKIIAKIKRLRLEIPDKWRWFKCYELSYFERPYIRKHWALVAGTENKGIVTSLALISQDCDSERKDFFKDKAVQFVEEAPETISFLLQHIEELESELSRLKDEGEPESNELYPCPYSIAVRCTMVDPCLGCETWAKYKAGEEISRLKSEGEDKLTCTDKCRWFNIGYGHCNFCIRQVKEHDCRDNFEPAEQSADKPMSPEEIVIRLKKDDLHQCSYFTASKMYDWCKKHKIKVQEPRNSKGYFDRFIITLKTPEQKILFYGKYIDVLEKIANHSQFVGEKVTDEENKVKSLIDDVCKWEDSPGYDSLEKTLSDKYDVRFKR